MSSSKDHKQDLLGRLSNIRTLFQWTLIVVLTILFISIYQPLHRLMGNGVTMISIVPVLLVGLFFGFRAGMVSALVFFVLDVFLIVYFQIATLTEILTTGIIFGVLALVIMGALVGYMSDLRKTLTAELNVKKLIENELETQRERVAEILNQQQDIVCRFTPDFTITYLNPVGQKFFRNQTNELVGTNLLTLFSEQESRFIRNFFARPEVKAKPIKFEFPLFNLKKEKLYFQWVATSILGNDDQLIEFQAVGRDITENRKIRKMEQEQRQVIEALSKSAAILNSSLDMNDVLKRILENIGSVVPHDAANIMLVKDQTAKIVQMVGYEKFVKDMESFKNLEFSLSIPNFHEMIMTDHGTIITNTKTDSRWQVFDSNHWIGSYLGAPLLFKNNLIGFLNLDCTRTDFYQEKHVGWLQAFADQAAIAIKNAQLFEEINERAQNLSHTNQILAAISEVAANTTLDLNLDEVLTFVGNALKKLHIETFIAFQSIEKNGADVLYSSIISRLDYSEDVVKLLEHHFSQLNADNFPYYESIFTKKKTLFINDGMGGMKNILSSSIQNVDKLLSLMDVTENYHAFISPLVVNDQVIGFITVWGDQVQHSDQSTLQILAMQVANLIEKNQLYQKIQQLAITDSLTGLYNRRGLEELGKHEIERALRFNRPLSTLMIDIDHFKHVNDHFGHPVGDEILVQLARRLQSKLRDVDVICRYGGEEFFIMLPETDIKNAFLIADRIRKLIHEDYFSTSAGIINITVSIGICYLSKNIDNLEDMINYADQALYQAKQTGRNKVNPYILETHPRN